MTDRTDAHGPSLGDGLRLRRLTSGDADALVPINDAATPAVPVTSAADLARLIELAALPLGVERDGILVGFVLALAPGVDYDSENYRYFESRGVDYLYVDRIVVDAGERGSGVGAVLYAEVFRAAREQGRAEVTCEVNLDPPNPGSLAFHARLGFEQLGAQATKDGTVTVALMSAPVHPLVVS